MWEVTVLKPGPIGIWDFPTGFFPRRTHYKKDAQAYADEATRKGAVGVEMRKVNGANDELTKENN